MREVWEEPQISVVANDEAMSTRVHVPRTCRVDTVVLVCPGDKRERTYSKTKPMKDQIL